MIPALIIVFREGFEAFLGVAVILAFLQKADRTWLRPAVYAGIAVSVVLSGALGYLMSLNQSPLLEGILGVVAVAFVVTFVIQVWRAASRMRREVEARVEARSSGGSRLKAMVGIFLFTVLMVTREGMEAAMMLIQVRSAPSFLLGSVVGLVAAAALSWAWVRLGRRVDVRRFFQVTGLFLLLFACQIAVYSVHEFSEAGVLPASEAIGAATENFSPVGKYGKWSSVVIVAGCALWLGAVSLVDRRRRERVRIPTVHDFAQKEQ